MALAATFRTLREKLESVRVALAELNVVSGGIDRNAVRLPTVPRPVEQFQENIEELSAEVEEAIRAADEGVAATRGAKPDLRDARRALATTHRLALRALESCSGKVASHATLNKLESQSLRGTQMKKWLQAVNGRVEASMAALLAVQDAVLECWETISELPAGNSMRPRELTPVLSSVLPLPPKFF